MITVVTDDKVEHEFENLEAAVLFIYSLVPEEDEPNGTVITPLPPNKIRTVPGIVTPKLPIQIEREQAERLSDLPEEIREDLWDI
jgi:hypothetical protein